MSRIRTFVAVDATPEIQAAGARLIQTLSAAVDGVRWVRPENIHLTLKFLGEVEDRELHQICHTVVDAAHQSEPFSLVSRGLGAFPTPSRPSTLWMGVDDVDGQLGNLQSRLESRLSELGFPREQRPFKGHFTLGRIRSRGVNPALTNLLQRHNDEEFGIFPVGEVVVYSSELSRSGPTYTPLAHCPLTSG